MPEQYKKIQAVFLIDTNIADDKDPNVAKEGLQRILFGMLRILSFLLLLQKGNDASATPPIVQWGYKFYSSNGRKKGIRTQRFREFRLSCFEEAEEELKSIAKSYDETSCSVGCGNNEDNPKKHHRTLSSTPPSGYLKTVLIDSILDFEWEAPDFRSPVKRKGKLIHQEELFNMNLVFLYTAAPVNTQTQRQFAGMRVLDEDVLLETFLPSSHIEKYREMNIKLNWIDTTCMFPNRENPRIDMKSFKYLARACKKAGGQLLGLDSIARQISATVDCSHASEIAQRELRLLAKTEVPPFCQMPSSLVLDLCLPTLRAVKLPSLQCFLSINPELCESGRGDQDITYELMLSPLIPALQALPLPQSKEQVSPGQENQPSLAAGRQDGDSGSQKSLPHRSPRILPHTPSPRKKAPLVGSENTAADQPQTSNPPAASHEKDALNKAKLEAYGQLKKNSTTEACLLPSKLYRVKSAPRQHKAWKAVVSSLHGSQHMLVMRVMKKGEEASPQLALLSPMGPTMACLCPLSADSALQVKLWMQRPEAADRIEAVNARLEQGVSHLGRGGNRLFSSEKLNFWFIPQRGLSAITSRSKSRRGQRKGLSVRVLSKLDIRCLTESCASPSHTSPALAKGKIQKRRSRRERDERRRHGSRQSSSSSLSARSCMDKLPLTRATLLLQRSQELMESQRLAMLEEEQQLRREKAAAAKAGTSAPATEQAPPAKLQPPLEVSHAELQYPLEAVMQGTEKDFCEHLAEIYTTALSNKDMQPCVQLLVSSCIIHQQQQLAPQPQKSAAEFLKEKGFVLSLAALREKYRLMDEKTKESKPKEYQLQILLHFEVALLECEPDRSFDAGTADVIVNMLRTLGIMCNPTFLHHFLEKTILVRYADSLPLLLVEVYDELQYPLPKCLKRFAPGSPGLSPSGSMVGSISGSMEGSIGGSSGMFPPSSNNSDPLHNSSLSGHSRRRKTRCHPSLSDFGTRKQILVETKVPQHKQKSKDSSTDSCKASRKPELSRVKKLLFVNDTPCKADRRKSVAVMQLRSPPRTSQGRNRSLVAETPVRKQVSLEERLKRRHRSFSECSVQVIQESPIKSPAVPGPSSRLSQSMQTSSSKPRRLGPKGLHHQVFYSGKQEHSRNLKKYLQLGDRMLGNKPRHEDGNAPPEQPDPHRHGKSQTVHRMQTRMLLSELMQSPSPRRGLLCTPVKQSPLAPTFGSPSENTRSKTPRKASKMLLFTTPTKEQQPMDFLGVERDMTFEWSSAPAGASTSAHPSLGRQASDGFEPLPVDSSSGAGTTWALGAQLGADCSRGLMDSTNTDHLKTPTKNALGKRPSLGFTPTKDTPDQGVEFVSPTKTPKKAKRKDQEAVTSPLKGVPHQSRTPVKTTLSPARTSGVDRSPLRYPIPDKQQRVEAWIMSSQGQAMQPGQSLTGTWMKPVATAGVLGESKPLPSPGLSAGTSTTTQAMPGVQWVRESRGQGQSQGLGSSPSSRQASAAAITRISLRRPSKAAKSPYFDSWPRKKSPHCSRPCSKESSPKAWPSGSGGVVIHGGLSDSGEKPVTPPNLSRKRKPSSTSSKKKKRHRTSTRQKEESSVPHQLLPWQRRLVCGQSEEEDSSAEEDVALPAPFSPEQVVRRTKQVLAGVDAGRSKELIGMQPSADLSPPLPSPEMGMEQLQGGSPELWSGGDEEPPAPQASVRLPPRLQGQGGRGEGFSSSPAGGSPAFGRSPGLQGRLSPISPGSVNHLLNSPLLTQGPSSRTKQRKLL